MASAGTITVKVNTEVGDDLEAAIRQIVRDEIATIAGDAAAHEEGCKVDGCSVFATLFTLAAEARQA